MLATGSSSGLTSGSTFALSLEFVAIFVALPLAVRWQPWRISPLPVLWAGTLYCLVVLLRDPGFERARLWNAHAGAPALWPVLAIFAASATVIGLGVAHYTPQLLFHLPRTHRALWAAVMLLYPPLSVYPQSIVYRAFLLHRYAGAYAMLPAGALRFLLPVLLSAAAFAYMHIVFRNPVAIVLTFLGGFLVAWHYQRTGSLAVSSLEHALYGCFMFTIGLGEYFYHARVKL